MLKKLIIFITFSICTGVALTAYLPSYVPADAHQASFTVNLPSLKKPIVSEDIQLSQLLSKRSEDAVNFALHLGYYGSLNAAKTAANQLASKEISLPTQATIFKVKQPSRQSYIILLGPFKTQFESATYQQQLNQHDLTISPVLWPASKANKSGNKT